LNSSIKQEVALSSTLHTDQVLDSSLSVDSDTSLARKRGGSKKRRRRRGRGRKRNKRKKGKRPQHDLSKRELKFIHAANARYIGPLPQLPASPPKQPEHDLTPL